LKSREESLPLDPALTFLQHLWEVDHALEKVSSRMERTLGVTAPQRLILRCVGKYPGMTAGTLAQTLHLDPGTISSALRRLEARGMLERHRDPRDGRRVVLGLTRSGRKLDSPRAGTVEAAVVAVLESTPKSQVRTTQDLLRRLARSLVHEATRVDI
jgi:MarR family transcriptional regulator, organic hydroperoxide resistance regulator